MTTSIVSTGSESVTFTPFRSSEMSADLNHVVASNFGVSSGDFTKSNSPVLNPFANNRSEQINKPFDANNYFEQREKFNNFNVLKNVDLSESTNVWILFFLKINFSSPH